MAVEYGFKQVENRLVSCGQVLGNPYKNIFSHHRLPYISKELVLLIRKKVRLYKQAVKLNTSNSWLKYNKARNRATSALRKAKQSFFTNLFSKIRSPKDFWSAYHKLSPKHNRIPEDLSYLSQIARDPKEKANLLNNFFCSCFNDNTPRRRFPIYYPPTRQEQHLVQMVSQASC